MSINERIVLLRLDLRDAPRATLPQGFHFSAFTPVAAREVENLFVAVRSDGLAGDSKQQIDWYEKVRANPQWDQDLVVLARATSDGILAGALHGWTSGFVKDLGVGSDFLRLGLARALVAEWARLMSSRGLRHIDLKARWENEPARALYHAIGFRSVSD